VEKQLLEKWIGKYDIDDKMLWKNFALQQMRGIGKFIENFIPNSDIYVISTHTSKSIKLPVYCIEIDGLKIILRNNFFNWKISVISDKEIIEDFSGLFHMDPPIDPDYTGDPLHHVYFEGFPKDLIFGYYNNSDKNKWSAEIHDDYRLYVTIFLILKSLGYVKDFKWSTRNEI
jgi:hypothetical protein